jgi:septal ring factor EnvC (AmiA/AmiB activator)
MGWGSWAFLAEHEDQLGEHEDQIADQGQRIRNLKKKLAEEARTIETTEASMIQLQVENDQLKLYLAAGG